VIKDTSQLAYKKRTYSYDGLRTSTTGQSNGLTGAMSFRRNVATINSSTTSVVPVSQTQQRA